MSSERRAPWTRRGAWQIAVLLAALPLVLTFGFCLFGGDHGVAPLSPHVCVGMLALAVTPMLLAADRGIGHRLFDRLPRLPVTPFSHLDPPPRLAVLV
jgi:hypothetical protein